MQDNKSRMLIQECRQIMTKRMRLSLTAMLNEVDDHLQRIAQTQTNPEDESDCYDAIREIRMKRVEIKTRFERRFINLFDSELQFLTSRGELTEETRLELSTSGQHVIVTPSMEQSLGSVKKECGQALLELDKKLSCLLNTPARLNPLQPEIVFEAFREACWDIKSGKSIQSLMFRAFEKRIRDDLKTIYADIITLLDHDEGDDNVENVITENQKKNNIRRNPTLLRYEVTERIENRLAGQEIPEFVRDFLLHHWKIFLEDVIRKYTENSIAWNAARQTMDDLIWLTNRDTSYYDRKRKVQLLPSLLFRLLNGMKVIAMNEEEINIFLRQLRQFQLRSLDEIDSETLDSITEEAILSVERNLSRVRH